MNELFEMLEPVIIMFSILVGIGIVIFITEHVMCMMESNAECKAYNLIAEEEEITINHIREQGKREQEMHKAQLELMHRQMKLIDEQMQELNKTEKPVTARGQICSMPAVNYVLFVGIRIQI